MRAFVPISIGAALGANARYWLALLVADWLGGAFPWGTYVVNISGALLIGFLLPLLTARTTWRLLLVTGFLGAYTTFSTLSYDTVRLIENGDLAGALLNAAGSLLLGLGATLLGIELSGRAWRSRQALVAEAEQVADE